MRLVYYGAPVRIPGVTKLIESNAGGLNGKIPLSGDKGSTPFRHYRPISSIGGVLACIQGERVRFLHGAIYPARL